jgi:hypothetical protein
MKGLAVFVISLISILPAETWAQTSQQYALMGRKLWAAYACAVTKDVTGEKDEEDRLFKIGYEQGKIFIEALQSGKIEKIDLDNQVPLTVLFVLRGPNVDFILGRIWEAVIDETTKEIFDAKDKPTQKVVAQRKYNQMNCGLI